MVFPSIQMIFLSVSPSLLFTSSFHFLYTFCIYSGAMLPITLCTVSCEGMPFSSPMYCFRNSSLDFAKISASSQSSALASFANNTMTTMSSSLCFTFFPAVCLQLILLFSISLSLLYTTFIIIITQFFNKSGFCSQNVHSCVCPVNAFSICVLAFYSCYIFN